MVLGLPFRDAWGRGCLCLLCLSLTELRELLRIFYCFLFRRTRTSNAHVSRRQSVYEVSKGRPLDAALCTMQIYTPECLAPPAPRTRARCRASGCLRCKRRIATKHYDACVHRCAGREPASHRAPKKHFIRAALKACARLIRPLPRTARARRRTSGDRSTQHALDAAARAAVVATVAHSTPDARRAARRSWRSPTK